MRQFVVAVEIDYCQFATIELELEIEGTYASFSTKDFNG